MTPYASPKLAAYAAVGATSLFAALLFGRPELAAVATPFLLFLTVGLARFSPPSVRIRVEVDRRSAVEDDQLAMSIELESPVAIESLRVSPIVPPSLIVDAPTVSVRLEGGQRRAANFTLRCQRWGAFHLGEVALSATDRSGLFVFRARHDRAIPVKVYPKSERLLTTPIPLETLPFVGVRVSRHRGDGIEFAETRPFVPGDRVRSINWRATARRGGLWVTERHPERSVDAVVFLDAFAGIQGSLGSSLDVAVRIAATVATAYMQERDRVAFVSFGGTLRWLMPASGQRQLYRILDALLDAQIELSYAWKNIDVIPARALPPGAVVVAITPLLDERTVNALFELRARGFGLAIIETPPKDFLDREASEAEGLARRVWMLQRQVLCRRFERLGVPVARWQRDVSLEALMKEVATFQRRAGRASA